MEGHPFGGFYSASKFALEGYTEALRHEVKRFNISVSLVELGFFKTNVVNVARLSTETIDDYAEMRQRVLTIIREGVQNGQDPKLVANTILGSFRVDRHGFGIPSGKGPGALE